MSLLEPEVTNIGEVLRRSLVVDESELETALTHQREHGGRLGEILVLQGACSKKDLDDALELQVKLRGRRPHAAAQELLERAMARAAPDTVGR